MTRDQARAMLRAAQAKVLQVRRADTVSPQKRRQAARKRLADRPKSVAARVLRELKLAPKGADVSRLISDARGLRHPGCESPVPRLSCAHDPIPLHGVRPH